ncbi:uncharacterized protein LOC142774617 [Rhipicephalus microplus]|uniref:uncharacterized protein LOC142774617 n=1 Tax=Rhipicephalus microplus TaxID=6941 RepID=UPI003F6D36FE
MCTSRRSRDSNPRPAGQQPSTLATRPPRRGHPELLLCGIILSHRHLCPPNKNINECFSTFDPIQSMLVPNARRLPHPASASWMGKSILEIPLYCGHDISASTRIPLMVPTSCLPNLHCLPCLACAS